MGPGRLRVCQARCSLEGYVLRLALTRMGGPGVSDNRGRIRACLWGGVGLGKAQGWDFRLLRSGEGFDGCHWGFATG